MDPTTADWPTVPVEALTAHPGNVREDLAITPEFVASIKAEGVRLPLLITTTDEPGALRVIDGHRRLLGAVEAGAKEVPYVIDQARAEDQAGQFLDMVITSRHAQQLSPFEEAAALFAAAECGASKTRLARAYGKRSDLAEALTVAKLPATTREAAAKAEYPWTMSELAALDEFADDEEAAARIIEAAEEHDCFAYQVERERIEREERKKREAVRAEAESAGVRVVDELSSSAVRVSWLSGPDDKAISVGEHGSCPGHVAAMAAYSPTLDYYCEDPAAYGHATRSTAKASDSPAADASPDTSAQRRRVREGNKDWRAAEAARRKYLTSFLARKSLSREHSDAVARFSARAYLAMPRPLVKSPYGAAEMQRTLLGVSGMPDWDAETTRAGARRLALLTFAPVAGAYEQFMTDKTWRLDTDYETRADRPHARVWLSFCRDIGYPLSPIERAVIDDRAYDPDDPMPKLTDEADPDPTGDQDEDDPDSDRDHPTETVAA